MDVSKLNVSKRYFINILILIDDTGQTFEKVIDRPLTMLFVKAIFIIIFFFLKNVPKSNKKKIYPGFLLRPSWNL